jgi:sugar phosphate isomerase/epimerase
MITDLLLHSVSYAGTWGQPVLAIESFLDRAAGLGFGGVMLMGKRPHLSVLDYDDTACLHLRDRLLERGLRTVVIAGYTNLTAGFAHSDIPQVEYQIAHIGRLAQIAGLLGGNLVRIFTGYDCPGVPFERQWQCIVGALREAASRAADFGVTLCVQNHHDIAVDTSTFRDLILEVAHPNCAAMFDAWAPANHGEDICASARLLAPHSLHTTVANYQVRDRFRYLPAQVSYERLSPRMQAVPMAEGFIDYRAFFHALESAGFNGSVAYEMCSPLQGGATLSNLDRHAAAFLEFMRSLSPAVALPHESSVPSGRKTRR